MAIISDKCSCGREIIVRTESDSKLVFRQDGKQVIYADKPLSDEYGHEYTIFRCEDCLQPIAESCPSAAYGPSK